MLILDILLSAITDQKCSHMSGIFTCRKQQVVQHLNSMMPIYCFPVSRCFHHDFSVLNLLESFRLYIWPQTPFFS